MQRGDLGRFDFALPTTTHSPDCDSRPCLREVRDLLPRPGSRDRLCARLSHVQDASHRHSRLNIKREPIWLIGQAEGGRRQTPQNLSSIPFENLIIRASIFQTDAHKQITIIVDHGRLASLSRIILVSSLNAFLCGSIFFSIDGLNSLSHISSTISTIVGSSSPLP